jgi:mannose/fructose-specific phosphotransferase system component IIA
MIFVTDLIDGATSTAALSVLAHLERRPVIAGLSLELLLALDEYLLYKDKGLSQVLQEVSQKTNLELFENFSL